MASISLHHNYNSNFSLFDQERNQEKSLFNSLSFDHKSSSQEMHSSLDEENLDALLLQIQSACSNIIDQVGSSDTHKALESLASNIDLSALETLIKKENPSFKDVLDESKKMLIKADFYLNSLNSTPQRGIKEFCEKYLEILNHVIENIINIFGIAEFFEPDQHFFSSDSKSGKIFSITNFFTLFTTLLSGFISAEMASCVVGVAFVVIFILSLIYPRIKPMSKQLPLGVNWTQSLANEQINASSGRKFILDKLAESLSNNTTIKTHPLLIGKSGVGKTETVKAFARAVKNGLYPNLKDKQFIYINTADIVNSQEMFGGGNRSLSKISKAMGRHKENYVLILDEIHLVCQSRQHLVLADQLKTLLDNNRENFPYVIGITTVEEYYRDIYPQTAFSRRFKKISIENTPFEDTLGIMGQFVLRQSPKTIVEKGALEAIYKKSKQAFPKGLEPALPLNILSKCLQKVESHYPSLLEEQLDKIKQKIDNMASKMLVCYDNDCDTLATYRDNLEGFEAEFLLLKEKISSVNLKTQILQELKEALFDAKIAMYKTAKKVALMASIGLDDCRMITLKTLLLSNFFLLPALQKSIKGLANQLGIDTLIDLELIEKVIQEELLDDQKSKSVIEQEGLAFL
jgi:ATP-dependent Clp protease ATP-binding subunit ClpA